MVLPLQLSLLHSCPKVSPTPRMLPSPILWALPGSFFWPNSRVCPFVSSEPLPSSFDQLRWLSLSHDPNLCRGCFDGLLPWALGDLHRDFEEPSLSYPNSWQLALGWIPLLHLLEVWPKVFCPSSPTSMLSTPLGFPRTLASPWALWSLAEPFWVLPSAVWNFGGSAVPPVCSSLGLSRGLGRECFPASPRFAQL